MSEGSVVRTAQPEDEEGILNLCRLLHEENGLYSMEPDRVRMVLAKAWAKDNVIIGVVGPIGEPVGCVGLTVDEVWYAGKPIIVELFNTVHPDHRAGKHHAEALIKFAKKVSDTLEMPMTMGVWTNKRTEAKIRFYQRLLEPAGFFFIHNRALAKIEPVAPDPIPESSDA